MPKRQREENVDVGDAPTDINPYSILSVEEDATQEEIRRSYRKAALKHHPDKAAPEDKEIAHTKFQEIAFAFAILSDERRRKRYDTTGSTEESLDLEDDDFDWISYYREQFAGIVNEESIRQFSETYKGSSEERSDLLRIYAKHAGSMAKVYQEVILSDMVDDEDRFRAIIDKAIENDEVEAFSDYTGESVNARKRRMERAIKRKDQDAKEAAMLKKEIEDNANKKKKTKNTKGQGNLGDLAAMIQGRQKDRGGDFLAKLEAKYAPKGKPSPKLDEPPEEAFERNAKKSRRSK